MGRIRACLSSPSGWHFKFWSGLTVREIHTCSWQFFNWLSCHWALRSPRYSIRSCGKWFRLSSCASAFLFSGTIHVYSWRLQCWIPESAIELSTPHLQACNTSRFHGSTHPPRFGVNTVLYRPRCGTTDGWGRSDDEQHVPWQSNFVEAGIKNLNMVLAGCGFWFSHPELSSWSESRICQG